MFLCTTSISLYFQNGDRRQSKVENVYATLYYAPHKQSVAFFNTGIAFLTLFKVLIVISSDKLKLIIATDT